MLNRLEPIILQKQREIAVLQTLIQNQSSHAMSQIVQGKTRRVSEKSFKNALRCSSLAIIAEIKRQSPSKGFLASIPDPSSLAKTYIEGGATAVSVLTDEVFFGGKLDDLRNVGMTLRDHANPVLRKDFILHEVQVAEAIVGGADAILCIVAILGKATKTLLAAAKAFNIDVLVEIHDEKELDIALLSGAEIIGVNNRDLSTFQVDTERAFTLIQKMPKDVIKVAESGILKPQLAQDYYQAGFDAVLIGEALVKSKSPADFMRACRYV